MTDFKPGDGAMRGSLKVTVVAVDGGLAWVRYENDAHSTVDMRDLDPIPAHPIPSEPNTAWVDKSGDFWIVDGEGVLLLAKDGKPAEWAGAYAPFTRLVPEGSEREAAIREVMDALKAAERGDSAAFATYKFLSEVGQ